MANKKSSGGTAAKIIAFLLAILLIVGTLFSVGYYLGWFEKDEEEEQGKEVSGGGATLSSGTSNGISLLSTSLGAANSTAESTYTLTATVTPGYATNQTLSWSIAWDTTYSGYSADEDCEDVNGDGWITGLASVDVSNYVSLSATTGSSVTVSCWQPFGNPIIITCSATDGSGVSATCKVDYQSYFTGFTVADLSSVTMSNSGTGTKLCTVNSKESTGTIAPSGTISYSIDCADCSAFMRGYVVGDYGGYNGYTDEDAWNWDVLPNSSNTSINGAYYKILFNFSTNWSTFVQELINGNTYITGNDSGYTYSQYGNYALIDFYNAINYKGINNFHPITVTASLTDSKTGTTYNASTSLTFSSLSTYPTYAVTGISMASSIVF